MPTPNRFVSRIYVLIDGNEVERPVMQKLNEVVVDQHTHLPDMFSITLRDPGMEILDQGPFDLTKEVEIRAAKEDGERVTLIKGEITALEPDFTEGMVATLRVRGFDKSHRLFRETRTKAFLNTKDSDLASEIAQGAGLQTEIETTSTVYDHIFQHNQTDLSFLMQRAWRIGYECYVSDSKLYFRPPGANGSNQLNLVWGNDLLTFHPRMTLAEQVDQVVVRGWDASSQEPIVGESQNGNLYPEIGESRDGAGWASIFGSGKKVIVNQPVFSQAEADALAAARLDELSGSFVEAEGTAYRRPDLRAGGQVQLEGLGERLSGSYMVTSATHIYTAEGLRTQFSVRGSRTGLLSEQMDHNPPLDRWPGAVIGIVTNTDDPNDWGRVKVKFPWMSEDAESDWARVLGIGAGEEAGLFIIPEVGDEVLVVFGHGDFSQPFILGGLWNGQDAPPPEGTGSGSGERPLVRTWHSLTGHWLAMYDNADNKVEIVTAGGHQVTMDDANGKLSVVSSGGLTIELDDNASKVTIESSNEIEIKAGGNLKIEASANLDLKAGGQVNVQGTVINLN